MSLDTGLMNTLAFLGLDIAHMCLKTGPELASTEFMELLK